MNIFIKKNNIIPPNEFNYFNKNNSKLYLKDTMDRLSDDISASYACKPLHLVFHC